MQPQKRSVDPLPVDGQICYSPVSFRDRSSPGGNASTLSDCAYLPASKAAGVSACGQNVATADEV
jgi:hypothetical protein